MEWSGIWHENKCPCEKEAAVGMPETFISMSPAYALYIWAESADRFAVLNWLDRGTVYLYDEGEWSESYIGVDIPMRTLLFF